MPLQRVEGVPDRLEGDAPGSPSRGAPQDEVLLGRRYAASHEDWRMRLLALGGAGSAHAMPQTPLSI